ncbi:hypothetical protein PSTG_19710, partial [Puccinia striiformis f. sp. tritici PST-78]
MVSLRFCFLAAFASPVALEPRGFVQGSSYDNSGSQSAANHAASNQVTPFGSSSSLSDSSSNSAYHNAGSQQVGMGGMGIGGGVGGFNNGAVIGNGFNGGLIGGANGGLVGGGGVGMSSMNAANSAS